MVTRQAILSTATTTFSIKASASTASRGSHRAGQKSQDRNRKQHTQNFFHNHLFLYHFFKTNFVTAKLKLRVAREARLATARNGWIASHRHCAGKESQNGKSHQHTQNFFHKFTSQIPSVANSTTSGFHGASIKAQHTEQLSNLKICNSSLAINLTFENSQITYRNYCVYSGLGAESKTIQKVKIEFR